jgi:hypothetical protein
MDSMNLQQYQLADDNMFEILSNDINKLNAICKQAIVDGYDGLDINILHQTVQENFYFDFPLFHEDDGEFKSSRTLQLIEKHADAMRHEHNWKAIEEAVFSAIPTIH